MSAEDGEQDLRERVRQLEAHVASLESRLHRLEAQPPPAAPSSALPPAVAAPSPMPPGPGAPTTPARPDLESHLGTYWLSRVGIVALITGIAYLISSRFGELGVLMRVGLGYLLSAGLGAFGLWLARRYQLFGRIVFGGGLALAYFVTYALHFIPSVRVIDSQALALVLLAAFVVAIVVIAHRMHSETVAGIALFLGLHTGMLSDITAFTLLSTSMLAAGALFFLVKNRWVIVPLSSLVAVYSTHIFWAMRTAGTPAAPGDDRLLLSLGFLSLYFLLFSAALLARPRELSARSCLAFALLNWVGWMLLGGHELARLTGSHFFTFLLVTTLAHGAQAAVAWWRQAPSALVHASLCLGALSLALAIPTRYSNEMLVVEWLIMGTLMGLLARGASSPALRWVAVGTLFAGLTRALLLLPLERPLLFAFAFACFLLVERSSELPAPWLPSAEALRRQGLVRILCAGGAGLSLLQVVAAWRPAGLDTLGWVLASFAMFTVGFAVHERRYRHVGLLLLALSLLRLLIVDLARLPTDQRVITFILLGVILLVISYIYTRLRDRTG